MMTKSIYIAVALSTAGCSGGDKAGAQLEADFSLGTTSERISDPSPTKTYLGQELHLTSAVTTSGGNHLSIIIRKDAVTSPGTFTVGLATDVQAGFTVPGSSGEVLFESGSVNLTAVNWSSGGQIAGTFSDLHRPADSLGVAPEARADGTLNISVP